jgi:hypothetical protein
MAEKISTKQPTSQKQIECPKYQQTPARKKQPPKTVCETLNKIF